MTASLAFTAACFDPPPEAVARLEAVRADGVVQQLEWNALEDRMLGTQARVLLWHEMKDRHQKVSAVACQNAATHSVAMMAHEEKQSRKLRLKKVASRQLPSQAVLAQTRETTRPSL